MRSYSNIKQIAKFQFMARYGMSVGAAFLFTLLAGSGGGSYGRTDFRFSNDSRFLIDSGLFTLIVALASIFFLVSIFISPPVSVGHAYFCRCIYNNWITSVKDMFRLGFGDYTRHLGGILWMRLFIFLWSLLFIIPGIVKAYAYFAAPYILSEFPYVRATDAIRISMRMTYGYKGEIFVMQFSFIGWYLLNIFTLGLLGIFYINPYYYTSMAGMYEELKNNALIRGAVRIEELTGYPAPAAGQGFQSY